MKNCLAVRSDDSNLLRWNLELPASRQRRLGKNLAQQKIKLADFPGSCSPPLAQPQNDIANRSRKGKHSKILQRSRSPRKSHQRNIDPIRRCPGHYPQRKRAFCPAFIPGSSTARGRSWAHNFSASFQIFHELFIDVAKHRHDFQSQSRKGRYNVAHRVSGGKAIPQLGKPQRGDTSPIILATFFIKPASSTPPANSAPQSASNCRDRNRATHRARADRAA
jgi:hypothetical protein